MTACTQGKIMLPRCSVSSGIADHRAQERGQENGARSHRDEVYRTSYWLSSTKLQVMIFDEQILPSAQTLYPTEVGSLSPLDCADDTLVSCVAGLNIKN
jgi:hypothetical protein